MASYVDPNAFVQHKNTSNDHNNKIKNLSISRESYERHTHEQTINVQSQPASVAVEDITDKTSPVIILPSKLIYNVEDETEFNEEGSSPKEGEEIATLEFDGKVNVFLMKLRFLILCR